MFQKAKEFFNKYKLYIFTATIVVLSLIANFWEPFWIVLCCVVSLFYITCDVSELFCLFAVHTCLSGVSFLAYGICFGVGLLSVFVRYFFDLKAKRVKFYPLPFYLTTFIICVFSLIVYDIDLLGLGDGVIIISLLYSIYLVFAYRKKMQPEKVFNCLILGLLASLFVGLALLPFKNALYYPIYYDEFYARLKLMTYHQNMLSSFCLVSIAYLIYKLFNKIGNMIINIALITVFLVLGLLTLSKAFAVVIAIYLFYIFVCTFKAYKKQATKILLPIIGIVLIFAIVGHNFISRIVDRLFAYYESGTIIQNITTGRSTIWQLYINALTSSCTSLLFGRGLFAAQLKEIGIHSSYLFLLYRLGIVGVLLLVGLCFAYIKEGNIKFKLSFKNALPLLSYLLISLEEMILSERCFFILIFSLFFIIDKNKEAKEETK